MAHGGRKIKIISVDGARPQFIKCFPISRELQKIHTHVLLHTGQHYDYDLSKIFFDQLDIIEPKYNIGVGSGTHGEQTGKMLIGIERILLKENPDLVLVYGDTNSTLAGTLAAVKLHIPVGHIEAGLRNFDNALPEEINRIIVDHSSDFLFVPTKTAMNNLKQEGITESVYLTGDVMYDALIYSLGIAEKSKILEKLNIKPNEYFLTTFHRPSNTDDVKNLSSILEALSEMDEEVVFPIHPRTLKFIKRYGLKKKIKENILLIKPMDYINFLWLEKNAKKIITDSGGIQKEAYLLKVPCITLMESTSWIETMEDGWNTLVGTDKEMIIKMAKSCKPVDKQQHNFGGGKASKKIGEIINNIKHLCKNRCGQKSKQGINE